MTLSFIKNLIPGTRTGAKGTESPTPSEESPKIGLNKEVSLVVCFFHDGSEEMSIVEAYFSNDKARKKAIELVKNKREDESYAVITHFIVDSNES